LTVFDSARQAIRAATDLQRQFAEETDADSDLPLRVGIGIDSGEAIELEDGSFRGAALNVAARLCGLAHGEEVIVSESTAHLAGRLPGLRYVDRGRAHLKGIADPVRVIRVAPEEEASTPWILMFFGRQGGIGWRVGFVVVFVAAATAAAVVYLTSGNKGEQGSAAPPPRDGTTTGGAGTQAEGTPDASSADVAALVPMALREGCKTQTVPDVGAVETAVCLPRAGGARFSPDRWQVSIYPDGAALSNAFEAERRSHRIAPDQGICSSLSWGGEGPWEHGPGRPGGRRLCYFEGDDAVIVWTHARRGQADHRDILGSARESGSDHARLARWWRYAHHLIGKLE
jgi:hypothetical protein